MKEVELGVGRHDEQAVGLRDAARDLGEELRARDAHGDGETDLLAHLSPKPSGDLEWSAGHLQQPGDIEERFVDRYPLDERGRPLEDREDGLARLDVGIETGWHD